MAKGPAESRELRDRLEAAQSELKRVHEELLSSQAECVALKDELEFVRWSRTEAKHVELQQALDASRQECEQLKWMLSAARPQRGGRSSKSRVCLISIQHTLDGGSFPVYVGFVVDPEGHTRDIVRTRRLSKAKQVASETAAELGTRVEDFS